MSRRRKRSAGSDVCLPTPVEMVDFLLKAVAMRNGTSPHSPALGTLHQHLQQDHATNAETLRPLARKSHHKASASRHKSGLCLARPGHRRSRRADSPALCSARPKHTLWGCSATHHRLEARAPSPGWCLHAMPNLPPSGAARGPGPVGWGPGRGADASRDAATPTILDAVRVDRGVSEQVPLSATAATSTVLRCGPTPTRDPAPIRLWGGVEQLFRGAAARAAPPTMTRPTNGCRAMRNTVPVRHARARRADKTQNLR